MKYYIDTCVWLDHLENRSGPGGRPLGSHATRLILEIVRKKDTIIFSDLNQNELKNKISAQDIDSAIEILKAMQALETVIVKQESYKEGQKLAKERNVPLGDAVHALIAKENNATLITQDRDFERLRDITKIMKPEDVIPNRAL
ncbi:TPA: type II toxin-antitoxin system VapC family toxin [Candidatus Woesearchaeota archaeon]|nr:type II toxin-antitoxin system VapC family toxin [Candidatus Woesearchaeota archaeon]